MRSLSARLALSLVLSLATFFVIQSILVNIESRRMAEEVIVSRLEHDMEEILAALSVHGGGFSIDMRRVPTIYRRPFSGHYFQLRIGTGKPVRSRSLWDEHLEVGKAGITSGLEGPMGQSLLVLSRSFVVHGRQVLLSVAEDISRQRVLARLFQRRLLLLSLVALLLLLGVQIWVVRRSLRPLAGLKGELRRLERGEIRALQQQVPTEIRPLVNEVNHLLVVLRQRLSRSRHAMGNLAHALKTPLTRMLQILDQRPTRAGQRALVDLVQNIEQRVEKELSRARMAGQTPGGFWPEPARDIRDLVATLEAVYQRHGIVALDIQEGIHVTADREDMLELMGNLFDNACKWAKSQVRLCVSGKGGLSIIVEDDGPGLNAARQGEVLQRGARMDESKQGHGLGLAIVREIVALYNGTLQMGRSTSLGGLCVSVHLPDITSGEK